MFLRKVDLECKKLPWGSHADIQINKKNIPFIAEDLDVLD